MKLTRGYRLTAKHVIHTPGSIWQDGTHGEEHPDMEHVTMVCFDSKSRWAYDAAVQKFDV